jgi:hypothetical protein
MANNATKYLFNIPHSLEQSHGAHSTLRLHRRRTGEIGRDKYGSERYLNARLHIGLTIPGVGTQTALQP